MDYPEEWNELPKHERRKRIRKLRREKEKRSELVSKVRSWVIITLVAVLLIGGIYLWQTNKEILPPTDPTGHIEDKPPAHIMDKPISYQIQKHMLEHADGNGPPGVIINYNCEDFDCEPDTIEKLKKIVESYPDNVYLAPYPRMSAKLVLTRHRRLEKLDKVDEEFIRSFIEN